MGSQLKPGRGAAGTALLAWLLRRALGMLGASWRLAPILGEEHLEAIIAARQPVILTFWHHDLGLAAQVLRRHALDRGMAIDALASRSRDGELAARVAAGWGAGVVRGSSSRGGGEALRLLYRALRRGESVLTTPDGPRGPARRVQEGTIVLAETSGAPLLPLGFAAATAWHLRSWDRLVVPRPFTRVAAAVGAPLALPRARGREEREAACRLLATELDALDRSAADRLAG